VKIQKLKIIPLYAKVLFKKKSHVYENKTIQGIIFSKDRPMQLYALLESYLKYCSPTPSVYVLYKISNEKYSVAYNEIKHIFYDKNIKFIEEKSFREDLINILQNISSEYLFFLVDDIIFKSFFSFEDYFALSDRNNYILSLRLGSNLSYCYTKSLSQKLPSFKEKGLFLKWKWRKGELDWNYVFSVDGNVYATNEILEMSKKISFKAPNSYESNMNTFHYILKRKDGLCYRNSVIINLCLNRVQNEFSNISGKISSEKLLHLWSNGQKIDIDYFYEINNISAHIEIEQLPLINRYE